MAAISPDHRLCEPALPRWEHFSHPADIGIRGIAPTLEAAFEQAGIALTAVITQECKNGKEWQRMGSGLA